MMEEEIKETYSQRFTTVWKSGLWDPLKPYNLEVNIEKRRVLAQFLSRSYNDVGMLRVLDMGCGRGENMQTMIDLGVKPSQIEGVDLMDEFLAVARENLSSSVRLHRADVSEYGTDSSYDVVMQYVLLSSILSEDDRQKICANARFFSIPTSRL